MRRTPIVPALTLVAALAITAAVLLRGGPVPLPPEDFAAASADAPDLAPATVDQAVPESDPAPTADTDAAADDARQELDGGAAEPDAFVLVTVLRGQPPEPAADVEVSWVALEFGQEQRRRLPAREPPVDDLDLAHRFGQHARTSADGQLRLPPIQQATLVTAADGNEFAGEVLEPGRHELRLRLVADETLHVLVVDGDGAPCGDVALEVYAKKRTCVWNGDSDAHGRADIPHFQQRRRGSKHLGLVATVPMADAAKGYLEFDWPKGAEEPVVLELPATAPLSLALHHRSGAPILAPVSIRFETPATFDDSWMPGRDFSNVTVAKPKGDEPLRLPHVTFGFELRPRLELRGERRGGPQPWLQPITLPSTTTSLIAVDALVPDCVTVLCGRFLGPDAEPLGDATLRYTLTTPQGPHVADTIETLADGRGDTLFLPPENTGTVLQLRSERDDGSVLGCSLPLAPLLPGERRDLGTVRLLPEPLLARGAVHDDRNEPVAGASVRIELLVPRDKNDAWIPAPYLGSRTAEDGTFALYGAVPQEPFRVHAGMRGHFVADTDRLSPGAVLDLRLVRHGILQGRIAVPDWLPDNSLRIELQADGDGAKTGGSLQRRRGWFWIGGLQQGLYTASIRMRSLPEPLAVFEGVRIEPGPNEDPRISGFDLENRLFCYRLRAIGPRGPLADLNGPILWRTTRSSGEPAVVAFRWQQGKAQILAPAAQLELTTLGPGLAPTAITVTPGERDVYLEPVQPFVVALPGVRGACGNRAVRVSAIFTGDTGMPQGLSGADQLSGEDFSFQRWELGKSGGGWLDAYDRAEIAVSRGGPHEFVLRIYESEKTQGRQESIPLGTINVVVDGSARSVTTIAVPQDKLAAALQNLQPREQQAPGVPRRGRR